LFLYHINTNEENFKKKYKINHIATRTDIVFMKEFW